MKQKITYKGEPLFTIPNIISMYRLFSFPFLATIAFLGFEKLFVILFIINIVSDAVDGFIARRFKMQTKIGSRIDSLADIGSYILAVIGVYCFKWAEFQPHLIPFLVFLGFFVGSQLFSFIKFGKFPSLHLYSTKTGGYIQGTFFFFLFAFDFYTWFFYFMIAEGILAFTESMVVQAIIPEMRSNAKGLYWVLKDRKSEAK